MNRKDTLLGVIIVTSILLLLIVVMQASAATDYKQCETAAVYVEEGNKLAQSEPVKAESLYREALKKCPDSVNVNYNLAVALYNQHKASDAVDVLKALLNNNPDYTDAMKMFAYILIDDGIDPDSGKKLAEKILEADPNDEGAKKLLVLALTKSIPTVPLTKIVKGQSAPLQTTTSDVDTDIPNTKIKNPDAIAVIFGNRDYIDKDIPSVDFAINDAEVLKKYFINVLGYKEGNIIFEMNASKGRFENIFGTKDDFKGRLYEYLKKGKSDIFVYYSGHGAPDPDTKQGYFVPSDADSKKIKNGYPLRLLYENITRIAKEMKTPNIYIVIDSCFSGATERGSLLKNVSPVGIVVENPLLTMPNAVVMTSSSGTEVSSWYPDMGHSMFTYFFLKALKEGAEKEGEIKLTAGTIFKQVADETEGVPYYARWLHGRIQTPQIMGDEAIVLLKK